MIFPLTVAGVVPQNRVIFSAGKGILDGVSTMTLTREEMTPNVINQIQGLLGSSTPLITVSDADGNTFTSSEWSSSFGAPSGIGGTLDLSPTFGQEIESRPYRTVEVTLSAEAADAVPVAIQLVDENGDDVAEQVDLLLTILMPSGIPAVVGAWTLTDAGAGVLITTDVQSQMIITTDATGLVEVDVDDVVGGVALTVQLLIEVLGGVDIGGGNKTRTAVVFA